MNKQGKFLTFKSLTTKKAATWLVNSDDIVVATIGKVISELNKSIKILEKEIKENMPKEALRLTSITGISTLTAATIYTETQGKRMTKAQFASYCGVAPVKCSSGMTTKFRTNKRGNRTLNSVMHSISICRARFDKIRSGYYQKKLQEGKTPKHAKSALPDSFATLFTRRFSTALCKLFVIIKRNIYWLFFTK